MTCPIRRPTAAAESRGNRPILWPRKSVRTHGRIRTRDVLPKTQSETPVPAPSEARAPMAAMNAAKLPVDGSVEGHHRLAGPRRPRAIFSADTTDPCASRTAEVDVDRTLQIATVDVTVGEADLRHPLQSRDAKQN